MNPFETSTYGNAPSSSPFGVQTYSFGQQGPGSQAGFRGQQGYPQSYPTQQNLFSRFSPNVFEQPPLSQNPYQFQPQNFGQSEYGPSLGHISPTEFVGTLLNPQQARFTPGQGFIDPIFLTELSRSARGLQEVAEQLETKDQEGQRRGYLAATAHLFYAFGVLSSRGIFIPSDLPTRTRTETVGAANACREFGRVLERLVDKYASGRGVLEELNMVVERGKTCYTEIIRVIEGSESSDQARKKAA